MKKKVISVIALLIMLVGVIVAMTAEIGTTTIYDPKDGTTNADVGLHVFTIMLFVVASDLLLFVANRSTSQSGKISTNSMLFHGTYAVSGLFFALASGYQARAKCISHFYASMTEAPSWYSDAVIRESHLEKLPQFASSFSSAATTWYVLTFIGIVATIVFAVKNKETLFE